MSKAPIGTIAGTTTQVEAHPRGQTSPAGQRTSQAAHPSNTYSSTINTNALGNLLSQTNQNQQSFLAHLLGLDHDGGDPSGVIHNVSRPAQTTRQSPALWLSTFKSMRLSDFTHGLEFTPAMGMFFLFAGFFVWLFILYGIRQNEQIANAVLGAEPNSSAPWAYDPRKPANSNIQFLGLSAAQKPSAPENTPYQSSSSSNSLSNQRFGAPFGDESTPQTQRAISSHALGGAGMSMAAPASQALDNSSFIVNQPILRAFESTQANNGRTSFAVATEESGSRRKLKFIVNN